MRLATSETDFVRVQEVLRSGQLIQGPVVLELEARLRELIGVEHGVAVANGTAALHLMLLACGVGPGDEVIVPAFSFVASANAVELCGARARFVDICLEDFNIDPAKLTAVITSRTRAIMPVHEFGMPARMGAILEIARQHGLQVLEDAACALGAQQDSAHCGDHGRASAFSFHPRKIVTSGEGGLIATNNRDIAEYCASMRNHGVDPNSKDRTYKAAGFNYRLSDIHAALLIGQLERFDANLQRRRDIAARYQMEIVSDVVQLPREREDVKSSWQTYFVMLRSEFDRQPFIAHLQDRGIQAGPGAQCIPSEPYYRHTRHENPSDYPNALAALKRGVAIPLFDTLTDDEASRVIDAINSYGGQCA